MDGFVKSLEPESHVALTAVLDLLEVAGRQYWRRPQFDVLAGKKYKGMGEIRFSGDNKTYRVFGYFGPQQLEFTLLSGHVKKGRLKHEMDQAAKRRDFAEANRELLYEFTI